MNPIEINLNQFEVNQKVNRNLQLNNSQPIQTSEKEMVSKEHGGAKVEGLSEEIIYRVEVPANRYDLLCLEGLARALLIFQNR